MEDAAEIIPYELDAASTAERNCARDIYTAPGKILQFMVV